ncbi:hypothetical protein Ancab_030080 [Ancistrocladus abbreviatus]
MSVRMCNLTSHSGASSQSLTDVAEMLHHQNDSATATNGQNFAYDAGMPIQWLSLIRWLVVTCAAIQWLSSVRHSKVL